MKNLKRRAFPQQLVAALLLLAAIAPQLLAVNYTFHQGRIEVEVILDGGPIPSFPTPSQAAFAQFFADPTEGVVTGIGPLADGSVNMSGHSPMTGDVYPAVCGSSATTYTYPHLNPAIAFVGTAQPTPTGLGPPYHGGMFVAMPGTAQDTLPSGLPVTPGVIDDGCIPYWVNLRHDLTPTGRKHFYAESFRSDLLLPYIAANGLPVDKRTSANLNPIIDPVGGIRVRLFCDPADGTGLAPLNVKSALITATLEPTVSLPACLPPYPGRPGSAGTVQASVNLPLPGGLLDETFLVRAGRGYKVTVEFVVSDTAGDVNGTVSAIITTPVPQGDMVDVIITVDTLFCDNGSGCVSAVGEMQMVGANIFLNCHPPSLRALWGPWENTRYATMGDITLPLPTPPAAVFGFPASYNYKLVDVIPSNLEPGPAGLYAPNAQFWFQTAGGFYEYMDLYANPRALDCVLGGIPEDLATLFVMNPGFVEGGIRLIGPPPCGPHSSCTQLITAATYQSPCDVTDFRYSASYVQAGGRGIARAAIKKNFATPTDFDGSYQIWLAGTDIEPSTQWFTGGLLLFLDNPSDPLHRSSLYFNDRLAATGNPSPGAPLVVIPQTTTVNDHEYCLSEIDVTYVNTGAQMIAEPILSGTGAYNGIYPPNTSRLADYEASATFYGTPTIPNYTTGNGTVRLCLPQGSFTLTPSVAYSLDGTTRAGTSQFPPFPINVGCGVCYTLTATEEGPGPIVNLTGPTDCTSQANHPLQGSVQAGAGHNLAEVTYTLNGGTPVVVFSGGSSAFNLGTVTIPLVACANTITISATDDQLQALSGSATFTITLDNTVPVITCPADPGVVCVEAVPPPYSSLLTFLAAGGTATDNCDNSLLFSLTSDSGLVGGCPGTVTRVYRVTDDCGNFAECTQVVTIDDTVEPVITTCPPARTLRSVSSTTCTAVLPDMTGEVLASDDCAFSVEQNPLPTSMLVGPGPHAVVITVSDACGNSTTCTFTVTVVGHGDPAWAWARQAGSEGTDSGNAVAVDRSGNVLVTGSFQGQMNFPHPISATVLQTLSGFGGHDIFLAKYNSLGDLQWAVRAGGAAQDVGYGVAVDDHGNTYVTGEFTGNVAFESHANGPTLSLSSSGGRDIYVAKYDLSGSCLWTIKAGGASDDRGAAIAVRGSGTEVFVTGYWWASSSQGEAFVLKLSGSGAVLAGGPAVSSGPSGQFAQGRSIAIDQGGNAYVTGIYGGATTFPPACLLPAVPGGGNIFVVKLDSNLACVWAEHSGHGAGASGAHDGTGIAIDPTGTFCYVTAYFNGTADFGAGVAVSNTKNNNLYDYLIAKFDLNGSPIWAINGNGPDMNADEETRGIATDPEGNPCVTGFLRPAAPNNQVNEGPTVLVASYDNVTGVLRWMRNATDGTAGPNPNAPQNTGLGVAVDRAGCVHVTGAFTEDFEFPPIGQPVATLNSVPPTERDMFVGRICPTCCTTQNMVDNGGFEVTVPVIAASSVSTFFNLTAGEAVTGWTTPGCGFAPQIEIWANAFGGIPASQGTNHLEINAGCEDQTVSQTVTRLETNCLARFCFAYTGRFGLSGGTPNNDFAVTLSTSSGVFLSVPLNPADHASGGWQTFCTSFVPTSQTITISFRGQPHSPVEGGAHIDDVSLTQCCSTSPPCPPNATLQITPDAGNIVISWSGSGYRLETTGVLANPGSATLWSSVAGLSPVTLPSSGTTRFFRLVCP